MKLSNFETYPALPDLPVEDEGRALEAPAVFKVGEVKVFGDVVLSPMDGFSDLPFRSICRELGSAMSYTEFINALDILQGHPHVSEKLAYLPNEHPIVFQIFDNDPDRLLEVALRLRSLNPDIIDINLGCSAKNVAGRGAGAGLLRTPLKIARIFHKLSSALDIPVTAKIRLGWDDNCRNYRLVARVIEENGGQLIAVHGRTKRQRYDGRADWDAIAEICQTVAIPVIGNGDVRTAQDIDRLKSHTGCQAVMVGRGAIGNPWIFSRLDRDQVPADQVWGVIRRHLDRSLAFYGAQRGLILFRKHASRYLSPFPLPGSLRQKILTAENPQDFLALLEFAVV